MIVNARAFIFFLREQVGLVRFSVGVVGICQMFCRNRWDWLRVLWEKVGLAETSAGAGGIG